MRIVTRNDTQTRRGPADWFTGAVWMDASRAGDPPDASVFRVFFEPGARTNWHTHPEGQVLYILTGTCRVARENGPPTDVEAGGVVFFAPIEKHWHGATPDTYMVHVAVSPANTSDGGTDWLEPVTDGQYSGA